MTLRAPVPARPVSRIMPVVTRSGIQALIVGLVVLAAVAASVMLVPGLPGLLGAALALVMAAIAVVDAQRFIIPNALTLAALALAAVNAASSEPQAAVAAVAFAALRGAGLALAFLALRALYARFRGREGLGLGDVKLAGAAGAWLSWLSIPIAIEIAALAAIAVYVVHNAVRGRPLLATGRLPFGAFLAPAIWIAWLLEATLLMAL